MTEKLIEMISRKKHYMSNFDDFQLTSISQKTKLITYTLGHKSHTSIWRRKEEWHLIFHQITSISDNSNIEAKD